MVSCWEDGKETSGFIEDGEIRDSLKGHSFSRKTSLPWWLLSHISYSYHGSEKRTNEASRVLLFQSESVTYRAQQCYHHVIHTIVSHITLPSSDTNIDLIFVVPCIMINSEINPTRCNNCVYSSQWLYSTCFG